jgi:hypothetical protein
VDNKPAPRQRFGGRGRFNQQRFQRRDQTQFVGGDVGQGASRERSRQQRIQSKKQQQWNTWAFNRNREQITYNSSVVGLVLALFTFHDVTSLFAGETRLGDESRARSACVRVTDLMQHPPGGE